jgi:hypothetical protein
MTRITFLLAGSALLACAAVVEDAPLAEPHEAGPVVATLELRDRQLTIASTGDGVRYDVTDASGTRPHLTLEQLEAFAPELAAIVRSASARHGLGLDARLDASVGNGSASGVGWAGR